MKDFFRPKEYVTPYDLDGRVPLKMALPLGFQHILVVFMSNLVPVIILTTSCGMTAGSSLQIVIMQNSIILMGLVTLLQIYKIGPIGCNLPLVMGTETAFLAVFGAIIATMGGSLHTYGALMGASLIGGGLEMLLGRYLKQLRRFFPPIVGGTVVLALGIALIDIAITIAGGGYGVPDFGSGENLFLAAVVLFSIVLFKHGTKGMTSLASILIGVLIGYATAAVMGTFLEHTFTYTNPATGAVVEATKSWVIDWSKVREAGWIAIPSLYPVPFVFDWRAIIPTCITFVITTTITLGNISVLTASALNREATMEELSGGALCDGFGSSLAAFFGVMPNSSYCSNIGIITMTKAVNRYSVASGAVLLLLIALCPKLVAAIAVMPQSVLGGAAILIFSTVIVGGMQLLSMAGFTDRNITIIALSLGGGYGIGANTAIQKIFPSYITMIIGGSGIVGAALFVLVLNILIPEKKHGLQVTK